MLECNRSMRKKFTLLTRVLAIVLPVICLVVILSQTVLTLNTYVISDGDRVAVHTTFATDPADVLSEAGFELKPNDYFVTQTGNGKSEITIQRQQNITIHAAGSIIQMQTYGETVEALLLRAGIILNEEDLISVELGDTTFDGMEIVITRNLHSVETYNIEIPYETLYCYAPNLPEGIEVVLTKGVNGVAEKCDNVLYVNGAESSRTPLSEKVVLEPVQEVIAIGSKINASPEGSSEAFDQMQLAAMTGMPIIGDGVIVTPQGEVLTYDSADIFKATAYHNTDPGCTIWTATGTLCRVGAIAVDPKVIPYGTRMYIVTNDGKYIYGIATAEDCGSAIKGNRVDLYFDTTDECWEFGIRDCTIYFLT